MARFCSRILGAAAKSLASISRLPIQRTVVPVLRVKSRRCREDDRSKPEPRERRLPARPGLRHERSSSLVEDPPHEARLQGRHFLSPTQPADDFLELSFPGFLPGESLANWLTNRFALAHSWAMVSTPVTSSVAEKTTLSPTLEDSR